VNQEEKSTPEHEFRPAENKSERTEQEEILTGKRNKLNQTERMRPQHRMATLGVELEEKRAEHCGERVQNLSGRNQCRGARNDEKDSTTKTKHRQQKLERTEKSLFEEQSDEPTGESRWETKILAAPN
jgi:hypothetical protein